MTKREASVRTERNVRRWREAKVMYRLPFRMCGSCGSPQIFRVHKDRVADVGFATYCWDCSLHDGPVERYKRGGGDPELGRAIKLWRTLSAEERDLLLTFIRERG